MDKPNPSGILTAIVAAIVIFIAAIFLPKLLFTNKIAALAATQATELILALVAVLIFGRGKFSEYGFRKSKLDLPTSTSFLRWIPAGLLALGVGAVATLIIASTGSSGNPLVRQLSFPQMILFVWIFSSTIEEIFTRGFLQGHLMRAMDIAKRVPILKVSYPTLISALFFSMMHLVIIMHGADALTVVIILIFTFTLGLIAGNQRAKTGSLFPAIGAHLLGNIGGLIGGIIYGIYIILTGGKIPGM